MKPARKTERARKMLKQRFSLEMKLSRSTSSFEYPNVTAISNNKCCCNSIGVLSYEAYFNGNLMQ